MSAELGGQYSDVLSAADVALYGGLTALASLERPELKASVLDSVGFRELLELNPEARSGFQGLPRVSRFSGLLELNPEARTRSTPVVCRWPGARLVWHLPRYA